MRISETHELTLSFNSSKELWDFAENYQGKIVGMSDYVVETHRWECVSCPHKESSCTDDTKDSQCCGHDNAEGGCIDDGKTEEMY